MRGGIVGLIDGDVIFLLHALDEIFDQLVELAFHLHLAEALAQFFIEQIAVHERLLDGLTQLFQCVLALHLVETRIGILKSALQEIIGEGVHQIFQAHLASGIRNVLFVAGKFHSVASSQ